ncbi:hypothetical protein Q7P35_006662 [Cladosporium inversicolor]
MAASTQSDRYTLPALQYTHGDVLIKLGRSQHDWLVVHSVSLSAASPKQRAVLSGRWAETIGIDKITHPRTGVEVEVKTLALKFVEGAYFLEGREVVEDWGLEAEVFQDPQWCEGWPQMGVDLLGGRSVLEVTKRAFRVLVATMHGMDLTGEQVAGLPGTADSRSEDFGASRWINEILFPQIVTVCAIAEYLACLATVRPAMMAVLNSAPRYWRAVAYAPIQHLMLAMKLKDREVFNDAYRHAAAHAYHRINGVTWPLIEEVTDMVGTYHQLQINMQFRKMRVSAENLRYELRRLETGADRRQWVQKPQDIRSILGMIIDGTSSEVRPISALH